MSAAALEHIVVPFSPPPFCPFADCRLVAIVVNIGELPRYDVRIGGGRGAPGKADIVREAA